MDAIDEQALAIMNGSANAEEAAAANESEAAEVDVVEVDDIDTPADETETPATDEPAEDADDEAIEAELDATEAAESDESDSLADLFEEIPSDEVLLKTHVKRLPQESKDAVLGYINKARTATETLNQIGNEEGVKVLAPIHSLLNKSVRSAEDRQEALASMLRTNTSATTEMLVEGALEVLLSSDKSPALREFSKAGDFVLSQRFGEGMTAERIEKYALLEKGGVIDLENDLALLDGTDSPLYQTQAETINEQTARIQELEELIKNPEKLTQASQVTVDAVKDLDGEISKRAEDKLSKVLERVGWPADSTLAKVTLASIHAELRDDPDYKEAIAFTKQNGRFNGEDYKTNLRIHAVVNKLTSRFGERSLAINNDRRSISQNSRNAQQKAKTQETKPAPAKLTNNVSSYSTIAPRGMEAQIRELYEKFPVQ